MRKRSLEDRVLNLEISNLYQSVTRRLIEIYDEQQRKPKQQSTSDASFDVPQAAIRLGVRPGLVRKLVREGCLRHHRIGRLLRFSQQDIDDFISSQKKDIQRKFPSIIKKRSATRRLGEAARGNSHGVFHVVPIPSLVVGEVAQILGCSAKTVHRLCNDGKLEFHWAGNKREFRPEDVDDYRTSKNLTLQPKNPKRVDSDAPPSIGSRKNHKGGDQKGSRQERKTTEVSRARRLKQLVEEMREW